MFWSSAGSRKRNRACQRHRVDDLMMPASCYIHRIPSVLRPWLKEQRYLTQALVPGLKPNRLLIWSPLYVSLAVVLRKKSAAVVCGLPVAIFATVLVFFSFPRSPSSFLWPSECSVSFGGLFHVVGSVRAESDFCQVEAHLLQSTEHECTIVISTIGPIITVN